MSAQAGPARFPIWSEKDLEDYLVAHSSVTGQDLLVMGRQVRVGGGVIDLLAIDSTGVIYILELKVNEALPPTIAQVLGYRRLIKRLGREEIIRVTGDGDGDGGDKGDLVHAFQRHFGHPLPETVNESQVVMIIAAKIHPITVNGILELLDEGYSIATFRYVVQTYAVSLIPCCRNDQDVKEGSHIGTEPTTPPNPVGAERYEWIYAGPINGGIRQFWVAHAQDFRPFVTFQYIFGIYRDWVSALEAEGARLPNEGVFAQHLLAIVAESDEWERVFVPQRSDMDTFNTYEAPPSIRTERTFGHVRAYLWNPTGRASELSR